MKSFASGGEVHTSARASSVEVSGDRVVSVNVDGPHGRWTLPVGELLSTIPLPELTRHLARNRPEFSGESRLGAHLVGRASVAADRLRFRALVFLNVPLARANVSENTWMYVASGSLRVSRIQEPKRRSRWMAPPSRTSMMLEIPCNVGDDVWTADARSLSERMRSELATLGLDIDDAIDAFVVRVEHGYPVYHLGYDDDRRALLAVVERLANVRTAGRQGLFRYVFMDAAMQMGLAAARLMAAGERAGGRLDAIGRADAVIETRALTA